MPFAKLEEKSVCKYFWERKLYNILENDLSEIKDSSYVEN